MANNGTAPDTERACDLMKKIGFAMLGTGDGKKLRARPSAYLERGHHAVYFLAEARRHNDEEIARDPTPGTVISYVRMAAAAVSGRRPDTGDNRKVAM